VVSSVGSILPSLLNLYRLYSLQSLLYVQQWLPGETLPVTGSRVLSDGIVLDYYLSKQNKFLLNSSNEGLMWNTHATIAVHKTSKWYTWLGRLRLAECWCCADDNCDSTGARWLSHFSVISVLKNCLWAFWLALSAVTMRQ
jgi:hypothetical protein